WSDAARKVIHPVLRPGIDSLRVAAQHMISLVAEIRPEFRKIEHDIGGCAEESNRNQDECCARVLEILHVGSKRARTKPRGAQDYPCTHHAGIFGGRRKSRQYGG